ncbi:sugar phosphate isomerase/epimerase [Anaerotignum lactatifermentans]|uniref:Sugar phosphate isomerase/epimerase n=1 Tax=Anaerotignum lactatifermentans TaxID=160404 RepID=A0ABS2GDV8_9FIRM|nr:sugar phosphate isomerase/epimerase family protein [Anaerotignum lactatifermentans]MBM6830243.1 sugar phosphate isomerase/epimerase [Anaerotignum lactatifermentans]MBM6878833.1 sugar phosphate isomerase/epimerase [Anaerotignum lactatifermentans]MBM6951856.1 sugar phosphate isomerase/epimerase [Anaerotignum lactatifermentans]
MVQIRRKQLCAMGIHYLYYPLEYMLEAQAKAGFQTIELVGQAPHFLLDHTGFQDPTPVRQMAEAAGLSIGCFTPECAVYPYTMCSPGQGGHDRSMEYFKRGLEAAEKLGAKRLLTNCIGGTFDEEYERVYDRAVNSLSLLAKTAADCGVTIAVETVRPEESRCIITLEELKRLLKDVGHPNVKAGLDTVAMAVAGETPEEWFAALGNGIVHTHFVDGRPYGHLVWGDGLFPLERYLEVLEKNGYDGLLSQEITDFRYFADPAAADERNYRAFLPYITEKGGESV